MKSNAAFCSPVIEVPCFLHPSLTTRRCKSGSQCQEATLERYVVGIDIFGRILNYRLTAADSFRTEAFYLLSTEHLIRTLAVRELFAGIHLLDDEVRQRVY